MSQLIFLVKNDTQMHIILVFVKNSYLPKIEAKQAKIGLRVVLCLFSRNLSLDCFDFFSPNAEGILESTAYWFFMKTITSRHLPTQN